MPVGALGNPVQAHDCGQTPHFAYKRVPGNQERSSHMQPHTFNRFSGAPGLGFRVKGLGFRV